MSGFHEVRFPLRLALGTSGGPVRRTDIVNLSNGRKNRNARWRDSRRSYDAGSGIRSVADLYQVLEFFEARRGGLYGFRFRDPLDWSSCGPGQTPSGMDQDRKSVVSGKSVSVRVDLGGGRIIKKKKQINKT